MVVELLGLSIGGTISSAAVSTRFAAEEHSFLASADRLKKVGFDPDLVVGFIQWLRYV